MLNNNIFIKQLRFWTAVLMLFALISPFGLSGAKNLNGMFPKKANYFLSWELSDEQATELAKWDLVILDMEHQIKNPDKILKMRQLNPDIVILAYVATQEIRDDLEIMKPYVPLRYQLYQGIKPEWWLKKSNGQSVSWWPQTLMLNITDLSPQAGGRQWGGYLADFVANKILTSGLWDGMFFDNTWNSLTGMVGNDLDIDGNGIAESTAVLENSYRAGMNNFFQLVSELSGNRYILMGNDGDSFTSIQGMMLENFSYARGWSKMMRDYRVFNQFSDDKFVVINANTAGIGGRDDYQKMRFGMASTLLGDGFYSFDLGGTDHGQTWWYDEYNFSLGEPAGQPFLVKNKGPETSSGQSASLIDFNQRGLWRRDFKAGLVLVNSGNVAETIDLGGEYEKLRGAQDPSVNDGLIVSSVTVQPQDGLILLRPLDEIRNAFFRNGSFARVFNSQGIAMRNGFFAYQKQFKGGQYLYRGDLDNDGETETIRLRLPAGRQGGNIVELYKGENFWRSWSPFGKSFKGDLSLAVADIDFDGKKDLIIGQHSLGNEVKIFNLDGLAIKKSFFPFAKSFRGGVNLTAGDINGNGQIQIIVGAASGSSQVKIFTSDGSLFKKGFTAFTGSAKGGVNVAAGDINGDGKAEIVTGRGAGKPEIKIFSAVGKQIGKSFLGASAKGKTGIAVTVSDVDNNGVDEIISLTTETFTTVMK